MLVTSVSSHQRDELREPGPSCGLTLGRSCAPQGEIEHGGGAGGGGLARHQAHGQEPGHQGGGGHHVPGRWEVTGAWRGSWGNCIRHLVRTRLTLHTALTLAGTHQISVTANK